MIENGAAFPTHDPKRSIKGDRKETMPHPWIAFGFGLAFAAVVVVSLVKSCVLCGRLTRKSERPGMFWFGIAVWAVLSVITLFGSGREIIRDQRTNPDPEVVKQISKEIEEMNKHEFKFPPPLTNQLNQTRK